MGKDSIVKINCMKCKEQTSSTNLTVVNTSGKKYSLKGNCEVCGCKQNRFINAADATKYTEMLSDGTSKEKGKGKNVSDISLKKLSLSDKKTKQKKGKHDEESSESGSSSSTSE